MGAERRRNLTLPEEEGIRGQRRQILNKASNDDLVS